MLRKYLMHLMKGITGAVILILIYSPASNAQIETDRNLVESAAQFGQIQYFWTLVEETGLEELLTDEDESFTVFAPTDQAFNNMDKEVLQGLLENPDELREVLRGHIISGSMVAEDLGTVDEITNLEDGVLEVEQHEKGINVGGALMVAADIVATNGVIHAVDNVLLP